MLVELVGCSGAGKSTVAHRAVEIATASGVAPESVALMPDAMLARAHLGRVTNAQLVNVVQDIAGLPHLMRSWPAIGPFVRDSCAHIRTQESSIGRRILDMRSVARRVGMFERARRTAHERVVLFDEGPVQSAHTLAYNEQSSTAQDLEQFLRRVPLPDVIVHVTAPIEDLVARARSRPDVRRQLHDKDAVDVERVLSNAAQLFDALMSSPAIRTRVLKVDNAGADGCADVAATWLAQRIVEWTTDRSGAAMADVAAEGNAS
jgi:thymidylate kinase